MTFIRVLLAKLMCKCFGHLTVRPSALPSMIGAFISPGALWVCLRCMESDGMADNFFAESPFERHVKEQEESARGKKS